MIDASATSGAFTTGLRARGWVIPASLVVMGTVPLLLFRSAGVLLVCTLLLLAAAAAAWPLIRSRIRIADGVLEVRPAWSASASIKLHALRTVTTTPVRLSVIPALVLEDRDGHRATARLGSWQAEERLIAILSDAVAAGHAWVDPDAAAILRERPSAVTWDERSKGRPVTVVGRTMGRLPGPIRWAAQLTLLLGALVGLYVAIFMAAFVSENVLFPRQVDPAWTSRSVVASHVDTWVGNVATADGQTLIATRDGVVGFWGQLQVRSSTDDETLWSSPIPVSAGADAARHTLVAGTGGSLWLAWARRGAAAQTQQLVIAGSDDAGASWRTPIMVAAPSGGIVGIPALVMTDRVRLVVYTDGESGQIWSQPLDASGGPHGPPSAIDTTTRTLYSDSAVVDGGLALTAIGSRAVLAYVHGDDEVRTRISDDVGRTWRSLDIDQELHSGRPRLATDGVTVALAVSDPNRSSRSGSPYLRIWRSTDLDRGWERGPDITDLAGLSEVELVWSAGRWRVLYAGCPGAITCATPGRVWYATSIDALTWSDPSIVTEPDWQQPIGIAASDDHISVFWADEHAGHDWDIVVSRRTKDVS